jgi:hypothetical protein
MSSTASASSVFSYLALVHNGKVLAIKLAVFFEELNTVVL